MSLHNFLSHTAALIALCITVMLSGCSKSQHSILETVPAEAELVATIDLDEILKNAGCQFSNGNVTLSDDLKKFISSYANNADSRTIETLVDLSRAIDLSQIIFFNYDGQPVVTFPITNASIFTEIMSEKCNETSEESGFNCYSFDKFTVADDGIQGWIAEYMDDISQALDAAETNHYGIYSGLINYLEDPDRTISAVIKAETIFENSLDGPFGKQLTDNQWICVGTTVNDNILGMELTAMDADGMQNDFSEYISVIDEDFLRYIPGNSQAAIAIGHITDVEGIFKTINPLLPPETRNMAAMIMPYLSAIDGTIAAAANPAAGSAFLGDFDLESWDITAMAHMQQSSINSLMSMISMNNAVNNKHFNTDNDPQHPTTTINGLTIHYGNYDGYFMASTREISSDCNNSFTQAFTGKLAALVIDIPYNSDTMNALRLPYGIYLTVALGDNAITGKFRFNGTGDPILATVVSLAAGNIDRNGNNRATEDIDTDDIIPENLESVEEN